MLVLTLNELREQLGGEIEPVHDNPMLNELKRGDRSDSVPSVAKFLIRLN